MDHTNGSDSAVSRWLGPLYAVWCELHYENRQMFFFREHSAFNTSRALISITSSIIIISRIYCFCQVLLLTSPVTSSSTASGPSQKQPWWDFPFFLHWISSLIAIQQFNICFYHLAYEPGPAHGFILWKRNLSFPAVAVSGSCSEFLSLLRNNLECPTLCE